VSAQQIKVKDAELKIIKNISENVIENSSLDFLVPSSGKIITHLDRSDYSEELKINADNNTWHYWNGLLNLSMLKMEEVTGEERYRTYVSDHIEFAFENVDVFREQYKDQNKWAYPFGQLIVMEDFDDCGAMGASVLEIYREDPKEEYREYIERVGEFMLGFPNRMDDGTYVRNRPKVTTVWGDDLYMSVVFLSRMGELSGDSRYYDEAILQVENYTKHLWDENASIFYHCYYPELGKNGVAHWLRGNGWMMMAQTELLKYLPENHPKRDQLLSMLYNQIIGVSRYQSSRGLWYQVLDYNDSYLESSGSAMLIYSIATAVNEGWIDESYAGIALKGWIGLCEKINADGSVEDICVGTNVRDYISYYTRRMTLTNDIHGLGAIILAGAEIVKMMETCDVYKFKQ